MRIHQVTLALFLGTFVLMYVTDVGASDTFQADTTASTTIVAGVSPSSQISEPEDPLEKKRSTNTKTAPASPSAPTDTPPVSNSPVDPLCGSSDILSCSVYAKLSGFRDPIRAFYSDKFHAACAYHDWCYRYGYATYGRSREACDDLLLMQTRNICEQADWTTVIIPGVSSADCQLAALAFYGAVRSAEKAKDSYKKGTAKCQYDGFCPPGKFETTGFLHNCTCPPGHPKVHTGLTNETAYCSRTVACPPGRFSTTGKYRGCYCPNGKKKNYELLAGNAYADCDNDAPCPSGEFSTKGKYHDCDCPDGTRKDYRGIFDSKAKCVPAGGGGGGGRRDTPPTKQK